MASVVLEGVSKSFPGGPIAVDNLQLEVADKEFLVLLGPSGCGKSTTLRLIAGLEEVSRGAIRIGQRVVADSGSSSIAPKDRNIAMVFQNYALYPHMSVYKNMAFGLTLRYGGGLPARIWKRLSDPAGAAELTLKRRGIRDTVCETARSLAIEHLLDRMPRQLSGGERQRVALGRAMVRHPAVFLFDEPLSNLDAKLRMEMRRELKLLHNRLQTTMIYVTHDQTEALTLGDRIAVMNEGQLQQVDRPMTVYDKPSNLFVASFIGSPPMNLYQASWKASKEQLTSGAHLGISLERQAAVLSDGQQVVVGFRPEDVEVLQVAENTQQEEQFGGSKLKREVAAVGRVSLLETLGDVLFVHVEIAERGEDGKNACRAVVCKASPRASIQYGETVGLRVNPERIHLFDSVSGQNLANCEDLQANADRM